MQDELTPEQRADMVMYLNQSAELEIDKAKRQYPYDVHGQTQCVEFAKAYQAGAAALQAEPELRREIAELKDRIQSLEAKYNPTDNWPTLEARLDDLMSDATTYALLYSKTKEEIDTLAEQVRVMREALEKYADEGNWMPLQQPVFLLLRGEAESVRRIYIGDNGLPGERAIEGFERAKVALSLPATEAEKRARENAKLAQQWEELWDTIPDEWTCKHPETGESLIDNIKDLRRDLQETQRRCAENARKGGK